MIQKDIHTVTILEIVKHLFKLNDKKRNTNYSYYYKSVGLNYKVTLRSKNDKCDTNYSYNYKSVGLSYKLYMLNKNCKFLFFFLF